MMMMVMFNHKQLQEIHRYTCRYHRK